MVILLVKVKIQWYICILWLQTLRDLISACLDQADKDGLQTMALPALGTGFLSYPAPKVAHILFDCVEHFSPQSLQEISIVVFRTEANCFKVMFYILEVSEDLNIH